MIDLINSLHSTRHNTEKKAPQKHYLLLQWIVVFIGLYSIKNIIQIGMIVKVAKTAKK